MSSDPSLDSIKLFIFDENIFLVISDSLNINIYMLYFLFEIIRFYVVWKKNLF